MYMQYSQFAKLWDSELQLMHNLCNIYTQIRWSPQRAWVLPTLWRFLPSSSPTPSQGSAQLSQQPALFQDWTLQKTARSVETKRGKKGYRRRGKGWVREGRQDWGRYRESENKCEKFRWAPGNQERQISAYFSHSPIHSGYPMMSYGPYGYYPMPYPPYGYPYPPYGVSSICRIRSEMIEEMERPASVQWIFEYAVDIGVVIICICEWVFWLCVHHVSSQGY